MSTHELLTKFSQAIHWNAWLYLVYKIIATALSFIMYYTMDAQTFSLQAQLLSIIFLLVFWVDCGFQKSIPRYYPEFIKHKISIKQFMYRLLAFKSLCLVCMIPVYAMLASKLTQNLNVPHAPYMVYIGAILMILEGSISVMRLVFHAYFEHKEFNTKASIALGLEMILCSAILVANVYTLVALFLAKCLSRIILLVMAGKALPQLYQRKTLNIDNNTANNSNTTLYKGFVQHSAIMWAKNGIRSITERNVLVPLFSHLFGIEAGNIFKVAHDGALLLYRVVVQAIGTSDTVLFSYVACHQKVKGAWQIAFTKLATKIASIALPLLGVVCVVYRHQLFLLHGTYVFHIFLFISSCFLIELLIGPYERVLEVKQKYRFLTAAYIPYFALCLLFLFPSTIKSFGLYQTIMLIHGVRLVSVISSAMMVRIAYDLRFPFRFISSLACIVALATVCLEFAISVVRPI